MAGYQGVGNRLRHAYDMLDFALVWKVYQDDLPPLKAGVAAALERLANAPEPPPNAGNGISRERSMIARSVLTLLVYPVGGTLA